MNLQGKSIAVRKDMEISYGGGVLSEKQSMLLMNLNKMRTEKKDTAFYVKTAEKIVENDNNKIFEKIIFANL